MKTPAYFQPATDQKVPPKGATISTFKSQKLFQTLFGKNFSCRALIRLLSLAIVSAILSMASSALAALQLGDRGEQVTFLQENLTATGYYKGPLTGYFGTLTQEAVVRFQQANELLADGIVDANTQAALDRQLAIAPNQTYNPIPSSRLLQRGDSGPDIEYLQRRLQAFGYYDGPFNSFFGPSTQTALLRFQQDRGLRVNGIGDAPTLAALSDRQNFPVRDRGSSIISGSRTIQRDSTGTDVSDLQRRLTKRNYYYGPISGYFDDATEAAVILLQRDYRLAADGIVGRNTWDVVLDEIPTPPVIPNPNIDARRYSVLDLQKRLQEKGFYYGPLDGEFGSQTRAAVEAAQRRYGVSQNDILDGRF